MNHTSASRARSQGVRRAERLAAVQRLEDGNGALVMGYETWCSMTSPDYAPSADATTNALGRPEPDPPFTAEEHAYARRVLLNAHVFVADEAARVCGESVIAARMEEVTTRVRLLLTGCVCRTHARTYDGALARPRLAASRHTHKHGARARATGHRWSASS